MKNLCLFLLLSLATPTLSVAQRLIPAPPANDDLEQVYEHIRFFPSGIGYVAGKYVLLRTDNGGSTWTELVDTYHDNRSPISDIQFVNESTIFLYGWSGFYRSTDSGRTFQPLKRNVHSIVTGGDDEVREGFSFVDAGHGWALGNEQLLITTDGGQTWGHWDTYTRFPSRLWMFNALRGIGVGAPHVIQTVDGGKTWQEIPDSPYIDELSCVPAGFCVGRSGGLDDPDAYMTSDFGQTWQQTDTGLIRRHDDAYAIQAIAPGDAVLVGSHQENLPIVYHDVDLRTPLPTTPPGYKLGPPRGLLLRWNGTSWQRREYPEVEYFWAIDFVTSTDVWASADTNGILHSTDGGQTWVAVNDHYRQIYALTPQPTPWYLTPVPTP